jgi:hypothetical protein
MKKYIIEIICLAVFLLMLIATAATAENYEYWQNDLAHEVATAVTEFHNEIETDPTDTGCLIAEIHLKNKINFILFSYRNNFAEEVNEEYYDEERALEISQNEDEAEDMLDAYGVYMDTLRFQD